MRLNPKVGALWLVGVLSMGAVAATNLLALSPSQAIEQFTQRRWSLAEGLPQVSATAIVQDDDGYLWVGTFGGLVRFDGVRFELVEGSGSCSSRILSLAIGPDGSVWVGTQRSGLCRVVRGELARVDFPAGLEIGGVADIEVASDGSVRLATAHGLVTIDGSRISRVSVAGGLPHESVTAIAERRDGSVWVGTRKGLCILRDAVCEVPDWSAPFSDVPVEAIHHSASGASWIGTARGLYKVLDSRAEKVFGEPGRASVQAITEDRDGGLWIGLAPGGVRRILPRLESLTGLDPNTNDSVADLFEDREGNLWIGTAGSGLVKLGQGAAVGIPLRRERELFPALPIVAEGGGRAWVGMRCGGLARVEPGRVTFYGAREGLAGACVESLLRDSRGTLWIGTFRGGLYRMEQDGSIRRAGDPPTLDRTVRALVESKDGRLLVGTDDGLFRFDRDAHRFELVAGTASLDIHSVVVDEDGAIWIGSLTGCRVVRAGHVEVVGREQGLSNDAVRAIHRDAAGVIWIGTYGGGLNRMEGKRIFAFGPEEGLPDRFVSRIIEDGQGRLWLSGNRGVTRVPRSELDAVARGLQASVVAIVFDATDGMPATQTIGGGQPAGAIDVDGKVWIPTVAGLAVFDAGNESSNLVPPAVRIEKVLVDGRAVDRSTGPVVLAAGTRNLEIHYTGLSFRAPEKVRFRYRLSGFDDRWVEAATRRVAYYPVIPSGDFDFRVIAANEDGVWNEEGANFRFRMEPRFVETWPFWILCAAGFSAAWGAALVIRSATAAGRERTLQKEVAKRTAELARLTKLTEVINQAVTVEEVLDRLYDDLRPVVPYDRIGLSLIDEDRSIVRAVWSRGELEAVGIQPGYEAPLEGSSLQAILESGSLRIIDDLEAYLAEHPESTSTRLILDEGIRSSLTCPLKAVDHPVGFIFFSSLEPHTYDQTHVAFLEQIAGHLSLIVQKSKLYEDLQRANRELENLASLDGLTGLANRRTFDAHLDREWRRAIRSGTEIVLVMVDIDRFKAFNDCYGHALGDEALRSVARVLGDTIQRAGDLAARYGGEEFAVILASSNRSAALALAERLRLGVEAIGLPHEGAERGVVTLSAGLALASPEIGSSPAILLRDADAALYEAKRAGRNRVVVHEPRRQEHRSADA